MLGPLFSFGLLVNGFLEGGVGKILKEIFLTATTPFIPNLLLLFGRACIGDSDLLRISNHEFFVPWNHVGLVST